MTKISTLPTSICGLIPVNPKPIHFIRVRLNDKKQTVDIRDIAYLESDSNYTLFHFRTGERKISAFTMKHHITAMGNTRYFFRINRSVYININAIAKVSNGHVFLKNRQSFRISRRREQAFNDFLQQAAFTY